MWYRNITAALRFGVTGTSTGTHLLITHPSPIQYLYWAMEIQEAGGRIAEDLGEAVASSQSTEAVTVKIDGM